MTTGSRIWITRAEPGASRTAQRLRAMGHHPVVAPLLAIQPLKDVRLPDLSAFAALAFTSPNGVEAFARLTDQGRDLPTFCVGDATRDSALAHGFNKATSARGDIHALADLIRTSGTPGPLLAPGAREPAGDLAALLPALNLTRLPVYAAVETHTPVPADIDTILIHSPRAARALASTLTADQASSYRLLTISDAATAPISGFNFKEIHISSHPSETSLLTPLGKPAGAV